MAGSRELKAVCTWVKASCVAMATKAFTRRRTAAGPFS